MREKSGSSERGLHPSGRRVWTLGIRTSSAPPPRHRCIFQQNTNWPLWIGLRVCESFWKYGDFIPTRSGSRTHLFLPFLSSLPPKQKVISAAENSSQRPSSRLISAILHSSVTVSGLL